MSNKSKSSSSSKTISLNSVPSELNVLDLADNLYYDIISGNDKGAISILRHDPLLANHVYDNEQGYLDIFYYYAGDIDGIGRATPLSIACISGNYAVVKELLKKQYYIDVNFKSNGNLTPLNLVDIEHEKGYLIIRKLINNGADINNMDSEGFTLFRFICEYSQLINPNFYPDIIDYLLKNPNLDINKTLRHDNGPIQTIVLQYCIREYNPDILNIIQKILKRKDLKINMIGRRGYNVLNILANEYRKQEPGYSDEKIKRLALLLIENGADPNNKDNKGKSALDNKLIQEVYFEYILSKVKKLQAKQRLKFATMLVDPKHESTPDDIIIKILKSLKMPPLNKGTLDKTNKLLIQTFQEELSKEIEQSLKKTFTGEKLDDMIEFYRKKIKQSHQRRQLLLLLQVLPNLLKLFQALR